ncbi:hypothetical protein GCM10009787_58750 [Streptomyces bangladeshensis]|uniref:Uncharacterized protein n=2 Tax=Streptomyces bangladeshensis TaxID=295352 RepID=A0ABN3BY86_9ACTN
MAPMTGTPRELLGPGGLVLDVRGRPGPAALRFETAEEGRRTVLRQRERTVLLGGLTGQGCCHDLRLHRLDGYRSPLPPIASSRMRSAVDWAHQYARWLEGSDATPLDDGRWHLARRTWFEPGVWSADLVRDWPAGLLELYCGGGWHGVLPLRRLSPPDAARVKAYRKHVRDGTLAPVLLWWVPFLDGWLILDGHDRAVAALAEDRTPPCVVLTRLPDEDAWRREAEQLAEGHRRHSARFTGTERQRRALEEGYGAVLAGLPYEPSAVRTWPLTGGTPAWEVLARAAMFQFPGD